MLASQYVTYMKILGDKMSQMERSSRQQIVPYPAKDPDSVLDQIILMKCDIN